MKHVLSTTLISLVLAFHLGCTQQAAAPAADPLCSQGIQAKLSWELVTNDGQVNTYGKAQPEHKPWSEALYSELDKNYDVLMTAKDIKTLIPNFDSLNRAQRLTVLAELMSTVAEYESSWNPLCTSKDVSGSLEPAKLARGLFQMNQADQSVYKSGTSYSYQELNDPIKNIKVAVGIVVTVIKVRGKITFSKTEKSPVLRFFFATLVTDTEYGAITLAAAKKRIAALKFQECK